MTNSELIEIRRLRSLHNDARICDGEFINEFWLLVMESPISTLDECVACVPASVRVPLRELLHEFAGRDYFDDRHPYILDGRTLEERRRHYRNMNSHYKQVTTTLLERLS